MNTSSEARLARVPRRQALVEIALIFAVFLVQAGLQPPDVNEPYYLAKARHYWDPGWCAGDLFLESADSHAVFYWTCGWLTRLMSLTATAVAGRVVTYALLAFSWRRLSMALLPAAWWSVLSAALLVTFGSRLHMAGEWIVGGFEAKGLAYACVLLGLGCVVRNQGSRAWILLGLATALHALVGGWSLLAAALAWLASSRDAGRPTILSMLPGMALGGLLALAGVWLAARLDWGVDPQITAKAAEIQVFQRLGHHLDPGNFFVRDGWPTEFALRFIALCALWAGLCLLPIPEPSPFGRGQGEGSVYPEQTLTPTLSQRERGTFWDGLVMEPAEAGRRRFERFVLFALCIAAAGMLIYLVTVVLLSDTIAAARLLRYYWFRLADAMVPAGAALAAVGYLARAMPRRRAWATAWLAAALLVASGHLGMRVWDRVTVPIPPADRKLAPDEARYADWLDLCRYIAATTHPRALFLTPPGGQTFKWHAGRPEVAVNKEMPQDAVSIVRWWDRLQQRDAAWGGPQPTAQLEVARLQALAGGYEAQYLVIRIKPGIDLPHHYLYRNNSFALYPAAAGP